MPDRPLPYKPGVMGSTLSLIACLARGFDQNGYPAKADELLADLRQGIDELLAARKARAEKEAPTK